MRADCPARTVIAIAILLGPAIGARAADIPAPPQPRVTGEASIPGALEIGNWRTQGPVELSASEMTAPGAEVPALRMRVDLSFEAREIRSYTALFFDYESPSDWSAYNRLVLPVFVEPSATPRGGGISVLLYAEDQPRRTLGPFIVPRGQWRQAEWDLTPIPRERVTSIMVVTGVHAHNPGEADEAI